MNLDINDMFTEQNRKIFINKLGLDLVNNSSAFSLSTANIVKIEIAKLFSFIKRTYSKYEVKADMDIIKKILSETKDSILGDLETLICDRQEKNNNYLTESETSAINKKYINNYHKAIDENEEDFENGVKLSVSENSNVRLYNQLINAYPCKNEKMQNEIFQQINVDFSNNIIRRIIDEGKHRSGTLKNMSLETYAYYKDLNSNTNTVKSRVKVMKNDC